MRGEGKGGSKNSKGKEALKKKAPKTWRQKLSAQLFKGCPGLRGSPDKRGQGKKNGWGGGRG